MSDYDDDDGSARPSFGGGGLGSSAPSEMRRGFNLGRRKMQDNSEDENPPKKPRLQATYGRGDKSGSGGNVGSFAQKMMANMGWKEGQGLGADGRGRLAPIETQQRPKGAGVGVVKEKTKQAKEEEKREAAFRGEVLHDSSDEERKRRKIRKDARKSAVTNGHGTPVNSLRQKPKYTTAEQVKEDLKGLEIPANVLDSALDLSGKGVQGFSTSGTFVPAQDDNEAAKASRRIQLELLACAETRHGLNDKKAFLDDTSTYIVESLDKEREQVQRAQQMLAVIAGLQDLAISGDVTSDKAYEWESTTLKLEAMEINFGADVEEYGLQEVAVAAIHPLLRSAMLEWEPLKDPTYLVKYFERLKHVLGIYSNSGDKTLEKRGEHKPSRRSRKSTTPYETLIYTLWLPRVRTVITSTWDVESPSSLVSLFESWRPVLPAFIYSNLINQFLLPRLVTTLSSWRPPRLSKKDRSSSQGFDAWLFPWLPHLPPHHLDPHASEGLLAEVKRRLRRLVSSHNLENGPPAYLLPWKTLLGTAYTTLLTTRLVPRLSAYLSTRLHIDPSDQDPEPMQTVLSYAPILSPATMAQILLSEFFPKFHAILHQWLTAAPIWGEIERWYLWWKGQIPAAIRESQTIWGEWIKAFNMMTLAMDLGDKAESELPEPESAPLSQPTTASGTPDTGAPMRAPPLMQSTAPRVTLSDSTFKDVLQSWCEENDLLLVALREAHEDTGAPIFRITASADQKGGVMVYLRGDILYARNKKDRALWDPMALSDQLVNRAGGR